MLSPRIVICGTHESRQRFSPGLSPSALSADLAASTLVIDMSLLSQLHAHIEHPFHLVLVVSSIAELEHMLRVVDDTHLRDAMIAGCIVSAHERAAIRMRALRSSFPCGICISSTADSLSTIEEEEEEEEDDDENTFTENNNNAENDRARTVFRAVVARWTQLSCSEEDEEGLVKDRLYVQTGNKRSQLVDISGTWGDPSWTDGQVLIIPPGWDSEPKVRAVADARGDSFERDIEPLMSETAKPDEKEVGSESDGKKNKKKKAQRADIWLKQHGQWLQCMANDAEAKENQRPTGRAAKLGAGEEGARKNDGGGGVQSNFFERLLSSAMRRP